MTRHAETLRRIARGEEPFDPDELLDAADYIDELFSVVIDVDLDGAPSVTRPVSPCDESTLAHPSQQGNTP